MLALSAARNVQRDGGQRRRVDGRAEKKQTQKISQFSDFSPIWVWTLHHSVFFFFLLWPKWEQVHLSSSSALLLFWTVHRARLNEAFCFLIGRLCRGEAAGHWAIMCAFLCVSLLATILPTAPCHTHMLALVSLPPRPHDLPPTTQPQHDAVTQTISVSTEICSQVLKTY